MVLIVIVVIAVIAAAAGESEESNKAANNQTTTTESTQQNNSEAEEEEVDLTKGQENALKSAETYLGTMSFSKSGLIDQLEFEGHTAEEAEYGASAVGY